MADQNLNIEIRRLQKVLEKELGWGPVSRWHSSMFDDLSSNIFDRTQVMLSAATLKRFFGVINHEGTPSISTLDALSSFVGFENWRAFKLSKKNRFKSIGRGISNKSIYVTLGFVLAIVTIALIANQRPEVSELPKNISFTSRPVTNTYPNSVVFDFDLKGSGTESFRIQQYWDPTKTIGLKPGQTQATGIYYFPGYFRAKLIADDQILKEHPLFLRSNGWMGTIDYEPIPKYFTPISDAEIAIAYPEELVSEIKESNQPLMSTYHYINDLGNVSGDTFEFEATIQNTYSEKWAVCQSSMLYFIGTEGAMIIPFSKVGCSSNDNLMLNDLFLNGKENDLSAFGTDLSAETHLRIFNSSQEINVFINHSKVYTANYEKTMGNLVGVRFRFLGLGKVKSFRLLDQNSNPISL